jgi:hypothetical protein
MAQINFENTFSQLLTESTQLAEKAFASYKNAAKTDAINLLDSVKTNLAAWTQELAAGSLSKDDFQFLVLGQQELITMNALHQAGVTMIQIDQLKNELLNQIISTILAII